MFPSHTPNLLRRTAAALSAVAAICIAAPAAAQGTVTLTGVGSCTYTGMSIAPNGNVTVNCQTSAPAPQEPGSVAINAPAQLTVNTNGTVSINRVNGTNGVISVNYNVTGGGCSAPAGSGSFGNGSATPISFTVTAGSTAGGNCQVNVSQTGGTGAGSTAATIAIAAAPVVTPPPPPASGNCPAAPLDLKTTAIENGGRNFFALLPGQIGSTDLPRTRAGWSSGQIKLSETSTSPDPVVTEISISKCQGVIDTSAAGTACYVRGGKNLTDITWMERGSSGINTKEVAAAFGVCFAPASEGPWYVNVRYNYSACLNANCAFNFQYGDGGIP
jgi:hypothetical protein